MAESVDEVLAQVAAAAPKLLRKSSPFTSNLKNLVKIFTTVSLTFEEMTYHNINTKKQRCRNIS